MAYTNQDLRKAGLKVTLPRVKILELLENAQQHHMRRCGLGDGLSSIDPV